MRRDGPNIFTYPAIIDNLTFYSKKGTLQMTEQPDLHQPVMTIAHQDMVTLHEDFTVQQALNDIRLQGIGEKIVYFYVVDTAGRLKGVILTRRLLTTPLEQRISEIMIKRLITVPHTATIMDAYDQLVHHKLLALPVVDPQQHILGVVDASTFMDDNYIKDITQRRKERLEIQRRHTRLRSILDHMRDLVLSFSYLDDFDRDRIDDFPFFDDHLVEIDSSALSFYDVPASYILHKKMSVFDFIHDLDRRKKCDYGLRNNSSAPRIAELIRRTIKESILEKNVIDLPPEIRIIPMTINSFTHEDCHSVKDLQEKFFLGLLSSRERNGFYRYTGKKINSKSGAVMLFQSNSSIIASAVYLGIKPVEKPVDGYNGYMVFDVNSIQVFDPIYQDAMRECWPNFKKISQAFQRLDPGGYPQFLRILSGIKSPHGYYTEEAVDISNPPEQVESTIFRILSDTELARLVKRIHSYECQICGHTIKFYDGSRYAESHHIQPLGKPHFGPDIKSNIICVYPNHHAELDYGARHIDMKLLKRAKDHKIDSIFIEYHNKNIFKNG
jgi:CBS domain-containing protein